MLVFELAGGGGATGELLLCAHVMWPRLMGGKDLRLY
jgi:hypothetical protein